MYVNDLTSAHPWKITMFNRKSTISMEIFHSYVQLPEGITPLNPIKPPFSYGFPMVKHPTSTHPCGAFLHPNGRSKGSASPIRQAGPCWYQ